MSTYYVQGSAEVITSLTFDFYADQISVEFGPGSYSGTITVIGTDIVDWSLGFYSPMLGWYDVSTPIDHTMSFNQVPTGGWIGSDYTPMCSSHSYCGVLAYDAFIPTPIPTTMSLMILFFLVVIFGQLAQLGRGIRFKS